jgi:hypothetical protein
MPPVVFQADVNIRTAKERMCIMKPWTKFFILTTVVNIVLSIMTVFTSLLKEVPVVDIATFYATAFGAGASVAALVVSMMYRKKMLDNSAQE